MSLGIGYTRIIARFHIRAGACYFPAVSKFYRIAYNQPTLGGQVILAIAIKISTKAAHLSLYKERS